MKKEKKTIKDLLEELQFPECPVEIAEPFFWRWKESGKEILIDFIKKLFQRFIEETKVEKKKFPPLPPKGIIPKMNYCAEKSHELKCAEVVGYNQALKDINQKQQKWLKENI